MEQHQGNCTSVLRYPDLRARGYFLNRTTLRRHIEAGLFPRPLRLGPNSIAWLVTDVQEWLNKRAAEAGVRR